MANDVYIQVTLADNRIVNMYSIDPLLTYNTDPDLYCEWTGTRGTYKLYNSALLIKNGKSSPHDPDKLYLIGTFLSLTEGNRLTSTPDVYANQNLNSYNNIVGTTTKMWHNNMTDNDGRYLVDYGVLTCATTLLGSAIVDWQEGALPIFRDEEEYMNFITNPYQAPPQYTWQSVPSISGKNGILQFMSTIVDMNDGDPITTSDTTKFTLAEESNVGVITEDIDDSIKSGADAGGISGSGENSAEQLYGYAFGQGETASGVSGGGGGLYGGFAGNLAE